MRADGVSLPGLAAGILIPALVAGLIAALALRPGAPPVLRAPDTSSPRILSREADLPVPAAAPALHPIVIRGGRAALGRDVSAPPIAPVRPALPARITVPSVGLTAPIVPVQAAPNGDVGVPPPGKAGWYDGGARPGEPGRAVLIGHVDNMAGHLAEFGRIANVRDGARIKMTDASGRVRAFQVVGRTQTRKTAFPRDDVYGASEHPVLVLITCGGPWLGRAHGGYRDNILVFARAVS